MEFGVLRRETKVETQTHPLYKGDREVPPACWNSPWQGDLGSSTAAPCPAGQELTAPMLEEVPCCWSGSASLGRSVEK